MSRSVTSGAAVVCRSCQTLDIMSKTLTRAKIIVITLLNLAVVGCSSIFAIDGHGTPGAMYWVLGIGAIWVTGFAARAFVLADRGDHRGAVSLVSSTLLYGFAFALSAALIEGVLGSLWKGR